MITIKEIIVLAEKYGLKNAIFHCADAACAPIEITDGVLWFKHSRGEETPVKSLSI